MPRAAGTLVIAPLTMTVMVALLTGGVGARASAATNGDAPLGSMRLSGDFNGDGHDDLAIGAPGATGGAGAVYVMSGSGSGLKAAHSQVWTLGSPGLNGPRPAPGDAFGTALAVGDFNGDGYADLAIGVPGKDGVLVLYGSRNGLQAAGSQFVHTQGPLGGSALAAGDFNGDGFSDLAVGDPFAGAKVPAAGSIEIHYGSHAGITTVRPGSGQRLTESTPGMPGPPPAANDNFGLALAAGDFNGDGIDDLAVGAPNGDYSHGAVIALYGSAAGITTRGSQFIATFGDGGGFALAAGNFNGDRYTDLAIGDPHTATSAVDAGAIEVHYGSARGLKQIASGTAQVFAEVSPGMPGPPTAAGDFFGYALAAGDFEGDGFDDVAVGIPGKSAVVVLRGSPGGVAVRGSQYVPGIGPQAASGFQPTGVSLAAGDFSHDRFADLVLGEPFTATTQAAAGVIEVHRGSVSGLADTTLGSAPVYSESTARMAGPGTGANDNFGFSLAGG